MNFDLTPEQARLQQQAQVFARDHVMPAAAAIDAENRIPPALLKDALEHQLVTGAGPDALVRGVLVSEALGRTSGAVALTIAMNIVNALILSRFGADAGRERAFSEASVARKDAPGDLVGLRGLGVLPAWLRAATPAGAADDQVWVSRVIRTLSAAVAVGIGRATLDEALAATRRRGGNPSQGVQFTLADMAASLDAAWMLSLKAAGELDGRRLGPEASMAAFRAAEAARRASDAALDVIGPEALQRGSTAERLMRDARALQVVIGGPEATRAEVADVILQ
jgi:alkylation response protein AidB-like acyl-CoA dehydrogenase